MIPKLPLNTIKYVLQDVVNEFCRHNISFAWLC